MLTVMGKDGAVVGSVTIISVRNRRAARDPMLAVFIGIEVGGEKPVSIPHAAEIRAAFPPCSVKSVVRPISVTNAVRQPHDLGSGSQTTIIGRRDLVVIPQVAVQRGSDLAQVIGTQRGIG